MLAKLVAGVLIAGVLYLCLATLVFATAFLMLQAGIATSLPWLNSIQRSLYHGGMRAIWQNQRDCVEFDERLVYRPRDGACRFANAEFDTTLTFSNRMRVHKPLEAARPGIAVLGDSHAMGWGVRDDETFASLLQERLGRPVYNLGVSSYGTPRELAALSASGVLGKVDTVLLQYSENDLDENRHHATPARAGAELAFAAVTASAEASAETRSRFVLSSLKHAFNFPMIALRRQLRGERSIDFSDHYHPLAAHLSKSEALRGKRVVVFYVNGDGVKFRNFPSGPDKAMPDVSFADLEIGRGNFHAVDDHMSAAGHKYVAGKLAELLQRR